ncbi:MAG: hypothetical protein ABI723_13215 [Bacteroidia bacterium]
MKIEESRILPECYCDTIWANFIYGKTVRHVLGSEVANAMKKMSSGLAIGIIDNDKRKPSYFDDFKQIDQSDGLRLLQKPKSKHYLIIIDPAIEKWILDMAAKGNVKHDYSFETLKKATKNDNANRDTKLKNFLNSIKQKDIKGVNDYRKWLKQLVHE